MLRTTILATALRGALLLANGIALSGPAIAAVSPHDAGAAQASTHSIGGFAANDPTSALAGVLPGRGANLPGAGIPTSGGDASDRTLTWDGTILPGTSMPGGNSSN